RALGAHPRGVVHGRRLPLEECGVSEYAAVRRGESADVASTSPRSMGDRGDAQPRQVLLPSASHGRWDASAGQPHQVASAARTQVQASASDPVTTEAFLAEVASRPHEHTSDATTRRPLAYGQAVMRYSLHPRERW